MQTEETTGPNRSQANTNPREPVQSNANHDPAAEKTPNSLSISESAVTDEESEAETENPLYIVGLGASAGGLEALVTFFEHMPNDSGMAFVVVQHLSPDHKSLMDELLGRHTRMEVLQVKDGMAVKANRIYLLPPKKNMILFNRKLLLTEPNHRRGLNLPIDIFFRSLAEDREEKAVGIILSGTGSDGTRGIYAVKQAGGMVMVQDDANAKFDGMPKSAIATGLVDFIRTPERMPEVLINYVSHPLITRKKAAGAEFNANDTDLTKIIALLRSRKAVDFTYYKPSTVIRRIQRRIGIAQMENLGSYLIHLQENPDEIDALFKDLLIGVTRFFRDREEFGFLRERVIPELFQNNHDTRKIRIWVAGCSTGEEAFTIAILLQDYMDTNREAYEVKIFATDIDKDSLEKGSMGYYPDGIAADMDPALLERYFTKTGEGFKVKRQIREMVIFAYQNILKDPPFTKLDLITCRNLLIYLQPRLQRDALSLFHFALKDGGYMFLGTSESVGSLSEHFLSIDGNVKIFRHKGSGEPPLRNVMKYSSPPAFSVGEARSEIQTPGLSMVPKKKLEAQERYYQELINELAPACAVVKENGELIETFGNPERFLSARRGKATYDIRKMILPELSLAITTGIRNSLKEGREIGYQNLRVTVGGQTRFVDLRFIPLHRGEIETPTVMIVFNEVHDDNRDPAEAAERTVGAAPDPQILDLEKEIQFTRENLQATIEELQTANEELQATNEELLASNEELQSTNEELNSVNEELNTVNAEYQTKIKELTELNNDLDNLIRCTEIGTIFLDGQLRIRKFTPAVTREVNLMEQDIGRPLADLSAPMITEVEEEARQVLRTAVRIDKTVFFPPETWFLVQILPYLDEKGIIGGVVITLMNISFQKKAEKAFQKQYEVLRRVVETSPAAIVMVNREGRIDFVNPQAEKTLDISREMLDEMRIDAPALKWVDLDDAVFSRGNNPFTLFLKSGGENGKFVIRRLREGGGEIVLNATGSPMFNDKGEVDGAVFRFDELARKNG